MEQIADNIYKVAGSYFLNGAKALVTFSDKNIFETPDAALVKLPEIEKKEYREAVPWGASNNLPGEVLALIEENPIACACLPHKIDVSYGGGVKIGYYDETDNFKAYTKKEILGNAQLKEIDNFFLRNDLPRVYSELITDLQWFYNGFIEIILNQDTSQTRKITKISAKEAVFSRWETANPDTGLIENHFYSAKWADGKPKAEEVIVTPVLGSTDIITELEERIGRIPNSDGETNDEMKFRYIIPVTMPWPGRKYYQKPYYYSIIQSGWLEFANALPKLKKALMTNSMTINYHVEIRDKYFDELFAKEGIKDKKDKEARVKKELTDINTYLKGSENAGKSWFSYFKYDGGNKIEIPDIKIKVIDKKMGGEYIEDSHEASSMIFIAFGVHPSLIGTIPGKTTSNLSGSDKRELLRIEQTMQKRLRDSILKPLYLIKQINKWPEELEFSIPDIILTTLDQGKEVQQINQ
jgi:hypothetical protein